MRQRRTVICERQETHRLSPTVPHHTTWRTPGCTGGRGHPGWAQRTPWVEEIKLTDQEDQAARIHRTEYKEGERSTKRTPEICRGSPLNQYQGTDQHTHVRRLSEDRESTNWNIRKDSKNLNTEKTEILDTKTTMSKIKNSQDGINSKLGITEERVVNLET